ncbi:MAG TPA: hypothetical protein PKD00_00555 [Burkholderiales bacterium]|nr:hypothetical protein [Burkholderiales bacterium]
MKLRDITPRNIKAFIEGYVRKWAIDFYNKHLSYVQEIVEWRKEQVRMKSPECLSNGQCKHCGCKTPELFYADKACGAQCYPEMQTKNQWIRFKNIISFNKPVSEDTEQNIEENGHQRN